MTKWEKEIQQVEADFNKAVAKNGIKAGFLAFAADDAVMHRNEVIYRGKAEIEAYFDKQTTELIKLEWEPDYIDVANSGDLAYTYGLYYGEYKDAQGETHEFSGVFHTVWKRQADGQWKYVWD